MKAKNLTRVLCFTLAAALGAGLCACNIKNTTDPEKNIDDVEKGDYSKYTRLLIDGGSQNAAYNSSKSLVYDAISNPYPYNTLERLVEDWNKANAAEYGYYFAVSENSIGNDYDVMSPMLNAGSAPEILFYLGTSVAADQKKGWFYDLSEVMETPNRYSEAGEPGSGKWKDIYASDLYASFFAPNGQLFTVTLEQNPIGIIYNKTLFEKAGVTGELETFKDFLDARDKVKAYADSQNRGDPGKDNYINPFVEEYPWFDSVLETTLTAAKMNELDVITPDGYLDAAEYVRGFATKVPDSADGNERIYAPDDERGVELYRLIGEMTKDFTTIADYDPVTHFIAGDVVMFEALGSTMRQVIDKIALTDAPFEVGVVPFPKLTSKPAGAEDSPYYSKIDTEGYYVQRGLSGYSTGWAITNSAMNRDERAGNTKCVDACVDMLMYLSSFKNNEKMVNDRGFAIPLSGNTTYEYFKELSEIFKADREDGKSVAWAAATAGDAMNKDYYDCVFNFRKRVVNAHGTMDEETLKSELTTQLRLNFSTSANHLIEQNGWDVKSWPAYGVTKDSL